MALISVNDAQELIQEQVVLQPVEEIPLEQAHGRILATSLAALRTHPPFDASAMDGYAVRASDVNIGKPLKVIGMSKAGQRFAGQLSGNEAVRIFTGAPMPEGANAVLIQEDTEKDGNMILPTETVRALQHVRKKGFDFEKSQTLIEANQKLEANTLALAAAMNHATLPVYKKPSVAILATGDELVCPSHEIGHEIGPDQVIASNVYGVQALCEKAGSTTKNYGIAKDDKAILNNILDKILNQKHDIIITTGGASVGDHDLIKPVLQDLGAEILFSKVAIKPGKPVIFAKIHNTLFIGLPGNPVSSLVCTMIFIMPMIAAMLGRKMTFHHASAKLLNDVEPNLDRQAYLRGSIRENIHGAYSVQVLDKQDSSILTSLAKSDCFVIRLPHAPRAKAGDDCEIMLF